jgi:hypothetical protein
MTQPQRVRIEFLALIDRVGIEPVSGESTVNIGARFRVYLCNHNDAKTHQIPKVPVTVQLTSQSENGTFDEKKVDLTEQQFSRDVRYVGTRMGYDTIVALAHYQNNELNGQSDRVIIFPWLTFIAGLLGTLLGALARVRLGKPNERRKNFFESLICGFSVSVIIIIFPSLIKVPQIIAYNQPPLEFVLALVVGFFGPELFKLLLAFVPSKS